MTDQPVTAVQVYMPALTIAESAGRYNALVEFVKTVMQSGRDYGVIPGTDKPTLLKPGAEKLCTLFGLKPEFEIVESIKDWEAGFFYFHYRCLLRRNGEIIATGEGSCNSREKKYRWRYVPDFKATDDEKARAARREQRNAKNGRPYTMLVIENAEPFDLVNTLQKMAQKRALIAAALIGVNASEFFTQDVEDMQTIEGDFTDVTPAEPEPVPAQASKPAGKNGAHGYDRASVEKRWNELWAEAKTLGLKVDPVPGDISPEEWVRWGRELAAAIANKKAEATHEPA